MRSESPAGNSGARILLAAGAFWGLEEALLGMTCAAAGRPPWLGSWLAGTAFLFLSGARASGLSRAGLMGAAAVCASVKLLGMALAGASPLLDRASGPVYAYFLQAALWAAGSPRIGRTARGPELFARGGAAGLLAALLFPSIRLLTVSSACLHAASGRYLSVQYAGLTATVAAVSAPLGAWLVLQARRNPAIRRALIEPRFALDGLSAAALVLTLMIATVSR